MLRRTLIWFTWIWAVVFIPIETYLSWSSAPTAFSGYAVNVVGVGFMLWGSLSLRRGRSYAEGLLSTGWAWTTATFWRGTNLRYWLAAQSEPLYYGHAELWLGPVFTMLAAAALAGSLVLMVRRTARMKDEGGRMNSNRHVK